MLKILTILITTSFSLSFCDSILSTKYDVEILRDTWGVPHIYGITDKDVAFGFALLCFTLLHIALHCFALHCYDLLLGGWSFGILWFYLILYWIS